MQGLREPEPGGRSGFGVRSEPRTGPVRLALGARCQSRGFGGNGLCTRRGETSESRHVLRLDAEKSASAPQHLSPRPPTRGLWRRRGLAPGSGPWASASSCHSCASVRMCSDMVQCVKPGLNPPCGLSVAGEDLKCPHLCSWSGCYCPC